MHNGRRDVIGRAQTGTGKTAAFGIPILEKLNHEEKVIQAMIICPTRELAIQVAEEIRELGKFKGIGFFPYTAASPLTGRSRLIDMYNPKLSLVLHT